MPRNNFEIIDRLKDTTTLITWAREQTLFPELWEGKPTKRLEHWRGKGVELLNYGRNWRIFNAPPIEDIPLLGQLRDCYYPEANSCLLYHYPQGVGIGEHTDKPVFNNQVVIINLIDAQPDLFGDKPPIKFKFNKDTQLLYDGDVLRFDALVPHSIPPVKVPRYSLSFRVVGDSLPITA